MRNEDGSVVVPESRKKKWKEYMEQLMNVKNTWESRTKLGRANSPTGVSGEKLLVAGHKGKKLLVDICNLIITKGRISSDW